MTVKKRDLIIAILRDEEMGRKMSHFLKFIQTHKPSDDFDAIIVSPIYGSSSTIGRFTFVPMTEQGHSFLTFAKYKELMRNYVNVWCVDYSMLQIKTTPNLSLLNYNDILFQYGKHVNEVDPAMYYGKSATIIELLKFLYHRKNYNATELELVQRWMKRNPSIVV
jgi:hypothetical protein